MQNNRAATRISRSIAAGLLSVFCSVSAMWARSDSSDRPAGRPESQAQTTTPSANTSTPSQTQDNSSQRIFGVVPAYNITDAQNAPSLTSAQKFGLFVEGTMDPFPVTLYALQAESVKRQTPITDMGKASPDTENALVLRYWTARP